MSPDTPKQPGHDGHEMLRRPAACKNESRERRKLEQKSSQQIHGSDNHS
jgi:hypothetical protein